MLDLIATIFYLIAVALTMYGGWASSEKFDNLDRKDVSDRNLKEMWFLFWDHREYYFIAAAFFLVASILIAIS